MLIRPYQQKDTSNLLIIVIIAEIYGSMYRFSCALVGFHEALPRVNEMLHDAVMFIQTIYVSHKQALVIVE